LSHAYSIPSKTSPKFGSHRRVPNLNVLKKHFMSLIKSWGFRDLSYG